MFEKDSGHWEELSNESSIFGNWSYSCQIARLLNFLQYILQRDQDLLMFKLFKAQCESPTNGDWVSNVKKERKKIINCNNTFEEISNMRKQTYQKMVNKKVKLSAFQYLLPKIKSKSKEINYYSLFQCQTF